MTRFDRQRLHRVDAQELLALQFQGVGDEAGDRDRQPAVLGAGRARLRCWPSTIHAGRGPSSSVAERDLQRSGDGQPVTGARARDWT